MLNKIKKIFKNMKGMYPSSTFKLVNVDGEPCNKNLTITYQVSGKATTVTEKPSVIINELMLLNGFSKEDADLIYSLAITERLCPSLRIVSIIFEDEPAKLEIEDIHSKYTLQLTAEEIVSSTQMLANFSHTDITMIYFQMMNEISRQKIITQNKKERRPSYETRGGVCVLKLPEAE